MIKSRLPHDRADLSCLSTQFALIALFAFVAIATSTGRAEAAVFAGVDDGTRSRFLGGAAPILGATIAINPSFPIDESLISGIAIDSNGFAHQSGVLITPRHYVAANHNATTAPWFRGSDGVIREYQTVSSVLLTTEYDLNGTLTMGNSDVRIWTLDDTAPLPTSHGVNPLPILVGPVGGFLGREIYASDQFNSFGRNVIDDVVISTFSSTAGVPNQPTLGIVYDFDSLSSGNAVGPDEIFLQGGDSGNAAIAIVDGQAALIGNHFGIDTTVSPALSVSTWLAPYVGQINAYTSQQAGGYTVSTILVVPEPSTATALLVGAVVLASRNRRRKSSSSAKC